MLLGEPRKNRNKKGLALVGSGSPSSSSPLISRAAPSRPDSNHKNTGAPLQVQPSYSSSLSPVGSPLLPVSAGHTPSLSSSSVSSHKQSYHNKLSEQLANLELGVEFKLDLKGEDLQVLNELGSGNGGTVSRCLHVPTGAIMARKVVHIATSESVRKQILRELQIMHDCSSPYIVSFYGAYLSDPHICMCMEFMDKSSLDNIYKKVGPIPEPILAKIALAVVIGLDYLYEVHKIMHRDVKPSNILLNSAGQIKICDFGVSGELINSVADTFVGTSTYMSPERISGDPYTVKSDVWSLGITLVELAIGRFPFSSDDEPPSSDDDDEEEESEIAFHQLEIRESDEEHETEVEVDVDETLSPVRPAKKEQSVKQAEEKRAARRASIQIGSTTSSGGTKLMTNGIGGRARTNSTPSTSRVRANKAKAKRKSVAGVSLAGSGHQMSILELLQYIVNEPAPKLPGGGRFRKETEEFVEATLRKEPMGWDLKKKGILPKGVARPTPRELLEYKFLRDAAVAETDVEAFARSIP